VRSRFARYRWLVPFLAAGALATVAACSRRSSPLRDGTGGIRVHVSGAARGARASLSVRPTADRAVASVRDVTNDVATVLDLAPAYYEVAVSAADGRGGFYGTLGGNGVLVRPGRVTDVTVSVRDGVSVEGRVVDAVTRAPLDGVLLGPPARVASDAWPVPLPCLFAVGGADGSFVLGGLAGSGDEASVVFARAGYREQTIALPVGATRARVHWDVALEPLPAPPPP
jgi:hypothetical protein